MQKNQKQGLWSIMAPVNSYIRWAMVVSALGGVLSVVGFVFLAYVIGLIMGGSINLFGFELGFQGALILLALITILSFLTKFYSFVISHLGAFKLEQILRTDITTHLAQIPLGHIITLGTGAIKKVLLDDVKNLHAFVADTTPMIAKAIVAPIASMVALFVIDYRLGLVAIAILLVGAVLMKFVMKDSVAHRQNYEQSQSEINKAVIEFVQAMPVVRTNGTLEFSPFVAALLVSTGMADSLMPLMWMSNFVKKSSAAAIRIEEIMDIPVLHISNTYKKIENTNIVFENVNFKYNEKDNYALKNINFEVKANTVTALVGPSGAGKSTVAKLIPRFWDVTSGSIKIGGIDIKEIDSQTLMDTVSFVFQDTFLFNDTLSNNIKMANPTATNEDMVQACKAAQIHEFILSLPNGYETTAGDRGTNLSGGQKQRITIARAILRNTPIVVLDEATAFADPENEEEIIKALANLMKNKTVIVIAHRLSTIKDVDQIVVFDNAEVKDYIHNL
ncbi:MAG: ABC transporter ATP-binding protein [Sulfurovaceae bacterium]